MTKISPVIVKILKRNSSPPVTARNSLLRAPALGPASRVQAKAPRNGGVTKDAMTSARTVFFQGRSVRVTSQPSNPQTMTALSPTQQEITIVLRIAVRKAGLVKTSA